MVALNVKGKQRITGRSLLPPLPKSFGRRRKIVELSRKHYVPSVHKSRHKNQSFVLYSITGGANSGKYFKISTIRQSLYFGGSGWTIDKIRGQVEPLSRLWMARCLEACRCTWSLFRTPQNCLPPWSLLLSSSWVHSQNMPLKAGLTGHRQGRVGENPIFFGTPPPPRSPCTRKKTSGDYPRKEIGVPAGYQLLWSTSYFPGSFCFDGFPGNLVMILFNPMPQWDGLILR